MQAQPPPHSRNRSDGVVAHASAVPGQAVTFRGDAAATATVVGAHGEATGPFPGRLDVTLGHRTVDPSAVDAAAVGPEPHHLRLVVPEQVVHRDVADRDAPGLAVGPGANKPPGPMSAG